MKIKIPVEKNQNYNVKVIDLTYQGLGVAKINDFPIFISNTLPGEEALIKVTKVKKNFSFGKLIQLKNKSPEREDNVDQKYLQTGIAPLQHLKYKYQLKFKQDQIENLFNKAKLNVDVLKTIGMDNPTHYRNKAEIPVRIINGQLETGFYKRQSHDLIPIEDFYIQDPKIDQVILIVRNILRQYHIKPYDEVNHKGVIRNIMVRRGHYTGEIMIGLITRTKEIPHIDSIISKIVDQTQDVKSIIQNINPKNSNVILGRKNKLLFGRKYINDQLLGLTFEISLQSFYQVNPVQTEKLYSLAIKKAQLNQNDTAIDAYCGIGTISLSLAKHIKRVYGVEIVNQAIENAKSNAKINHIKNVKFVANKAEKQIVKWQEKGLKPSAIFVDPPRKGLASSFIDTAGKMAPHKIVYISCNPSTLVRDARCLMKYGYHINQPIQPVDQFPQTVHVESITVFEK
ncbi:putative RNA methyltransferase [Philodulcilactobacillus myokoensis]|uniref:RNA methyltransferase n=1 Tax=Philodulcilactobacillus myokoensis TaxID=2929573 RepID=A0A9W6B1G5_9LACO|nr:23S rRNA (uracil(1939)-C(5))-methyltransferase RlmD [Philodulcilactobacillus myokoensis]GLB46648.1 putative RNA methyltransferase [Philodulcilactobacillus myokoensis]